MCEAGSSSECQGGEEEKGRGRTLYSSRSSIGLRRKASLVGGSVEVGIGKSRSFGREVKASIQLPPLRSPTSRILSFKRLLGRERKVSVSPSSDGGGAVGECSSNDPRLESLS